KLAQYGFHRQKGGGGLKQLIISCVLFGCTVNAQTIQMGVMYACGATGRNFKVFSCTGTNAAATCDMQAFLGAQAGPRGPAPRSQVLALAQVCQPLQPGQAPPAAAAPAAMLGAMEGVKIGDAVDIVTAQGWTRGGKVVGINGPNYRVEINGIQVTKTYPAEIRRVG